MNKILYYPVKPLHINQPFGANEEYYFSHFGDKGHAGIDFMASHGNPVYASHDGIATCVKDAHGGEGVYLYGDGFLTNYWHLIGDTDPNFPPPIPLDNIYHNVKAGDLIGYADNTGAPFESTGDHLHFGLAMTNSMKQIINTDNGTHGFINPEPFFSGIFAQDIAKLTILESMLVGVLTRLRDYLLNRKK